MKKVKVLVIGNWKVYIETRNEATLLARAMKKLSGSNPLCDVVIAPPFPHVSLVASALKQTHVRVGAQTLSASAAGAHTGEVTAVMLKDAGASFVIVGHSERRAAGETSAIISEKISAALRHGIRVVLCIGELERSEDSENSTYFEYINEQLHASLEGVSQKDSAKIIVAYEPVWAIGKNGEDAVKPAALREVAIFIRKTLVGMFGREAALKIPIIYGGSVDSYNVGVLSTEGGVQGFLVGRASTDAKKFGELLAAIGRAQTLSTGKKK